MHTGIAYDLKTDFEAAASGPDDALSAQRVRPILMTVLTSVSGLIPMAMSEPRGEGIDYRALATCVAGGLTASTIFTLWVVPLAYTVLVDLAVAVRTQVAWAVRRRVRKAPETPQSAPN